MTTISIVGKVKAIAGVLIAALGTPPDALLTAARGVGRPSQLRRHLILTLARRFLDSLSIPQVQWLAGTTKRNYERWTTRRGLTPSTITLKKTATLKKQTEAFWIGDPAADSVILYCHGGGYALPGAAGSFNYLTTVIEAAHRENKSLAAAVLQYDLAPQFQYPHQLEQGVELLRYLLTDLGKSPKQITLFGESAGGHLALGILSHCLSPKPGIDPVKLAGSLCTVVACSPVVTMKTTGQGFEQLEAYEPASRAIRKIWRHNMISPTMAPDALIDYLHNEERWWQPLQNIVQDVLITAAKNEMMSEDICALAQKMKNGAGSNMIDLFVSPNDFHAEPAAGPALGFPEGDMAQVIRSWIVKRL